MAQIETWLKSDLKQIVKVQELDGQLFTADNQANLIGVIVTDKGAPATLAGGVVGYVIRSDGETVIISGTASQNKAYIILPASAYVKAGPIHIVIKLGQTTLAACTSYVGQSTTDTIVDPGHVVPSLEELLAQIENCRAATTAANTAATNANTKASAADTAATNANNKASAANTAAAAANDAASNANAKASAANTAASAANTAASAANSAASNANTKAGLADTAATNANNKASAANTAAGAANDAAAAANSAASNANTKATAANNAATSANSAASAANTAAGKIDDMTVAANGLPAGSSPTVAISEVSGHKHILFGLVKGDPGKDFRIRKTFASIAAMQAYDPDQDPSSSKVLAYDFVMIDTGSVEDADTGKLYCYEPEETDVWHYIGDLSGKQGIKGETGTGIDHITLNADYTLTIYYDNNTSQTTASIRGETGATPDISVGTVMTLEPEESAYVELDESSTPEAPVFNFGLPKGEPGQVDNVYGSTVPMSPNDSTKVKAAIEAKLDANQGSANAGKFMQVGSGGAVVYESPALYELGLSVVNGKVCHTYQKEVNE